MFLLTAGMKLSWPECTVSSRLGLGYLLWAGYESCPSTLGYTLTLYTVRLYLVTLIIVAMTSDSYNLLRSDATLIYRYNDLGLSLQ